MKPFERFRNRLKEIRDQRQREKKSSLWVWIQIAVLVAQIIKLLFAGKKK